MATLFTLPDRTAFNSNGLPSPGAKAYFYLTGTTTLTDVYTTSALTTAHANPVVADSAGRLPPIYMDPNVNYKLVLTDKNDVAIGSTIDPLGPYASYTSLASLEAVTGQSVDDLAYLTASGRSGLFKWSASDLSTEVTADTEQGIYIAPSSDDTGASGAWVREYDGPAFIEWFGGGSGKSATVNDAAIAAGGAVGVAESVTLAFTPGNTYNVTQPVFPDGAIVQAKGATLRSDGTLTGSDVTVTVGDNCRFDELRVTTPGTETNSNFMELGTGVTIDLLDVRADAQRGNGGVFYTGQDVSIERFVARKFDRPMHIFNDSTTTQTEGTYIGFLDIEDYVRGFRADFCSFDVGGAHMRGRSANASKTSGHNGVLILGCADWSFGDCRIDDAGEHAFRIGGSPTGAETKNYRIGDIYAARPGGCVFKINPTSLESAGVTETAKNGQVGNVTGVDVGDGSLAGNEEVVRLTHVRGLTMGDIRAYTDAESVSGQYALQINDAVGVTIAGIGCDDVNTAFVSIDGASDVDEVSFFGGDVTDLVIGRLYGTSNATSAIGVNTAFNVGRIVIRLDGLQGFSTNLLLWTAGTITDTFEMIGRVEGTVGPVISGTPTSGNFIVDLSWGLTRQIGKGAGMRNTADYEFMPNAPDFADIDPNGFFINGSRATSGNGEYGPGVEFARPGSARRGAGIWPVQGSSDNKECGVIVLVGDTTTTADESLTGCAVFKHYRTLNLPAFPVYADNAAAVTGGLVTGDIYRTTAGDVKAVT